MRVNGRLHPQNRKVKQYYLTKSGIELYPLIYDLIIWSKQHLDMKYHPISVDWYKKNEKLDRKKSIDNTVLSYKKFKLGRKLNNAVIIAEAKETLFCLNLAVLVIMGVGVNYFFDIWYFDPVAALLMIPWLFREYREHK